MLKVVKASSLEALIKEVIPKDVYDPKALSYKGKEIPEGITENQFMDYFSILMKKNKKYKSYIGLGYAGTIIPPVIQRNVFENPVWYTSYTPYQAEISQGRLEGLLNYQTMISEMTGLEISNASLLDDATAGAEALHFCYNISNKEKPMFFISDNVFPHIKEVIKTKAKFQGLDIVEGNPNEFDFEKNAKQLCGALLQTPDNYGLFKDYSPLIKRLNELEIGSVVCTDLLSLALFKTPGEMGADITFGSCQRFGVPQGYGGPYSAFFSAKDTHIRKMPGRICGISLDRFKDKGVRLAVTTREQHIRREKATSNICTGRVLLFFSHLP